MPACKEIAAMPGENQGERFILEKSMKQKSSFGQ